MGVGEKAGFESRGAEDHLLCQGDALDGEELLGIDGLVAGDGVGFELRDFIEFFETDDGEGRRSETMFDGIAGRSGLPFRGARAGGCNGVGAVGGETFLGKRFGRV